jgi:hypothetical protein
MQAVYISPPQQKNLNRFSGRSMKIKQLKVAVAVSLGITALTGCMGQMGLSQVVTKGNLMAVDNRYGRAGLFVLLAPIYGIASIADLFIFNSIEFWTGKNVITGKSPAVVDAPVDSIFKVNNKLDKSLTTVPVQVNSSNIQSASFEQIDDNTLAMNIVYLNGVNQTIRGQKDEELVHFYLEDTLITTVSVKELEDYVAQTTASRS